MQIPSREDFLQKSGEGKPIVVWREFLADFETPLSAYWKLAHDEAYSFLLESVTGGEQLARYSILGARPRVVLRTKGNSARKFTRSGEQRLEIPEGKDPLHLLEEELKPFEMANEPGLPKFFGGAVGMLGYDLVRYFEKITENAEDDLNIDDLAMMIPESVVVFDHAKNLLRILVIAEPTSNGYDHASAEIERVSALLKRPLPAIPQSRAESLEAVSNVTQEAFEAAVQTAIDAIGEGEGIQFVLSQRFETPVQAHPVSVYRSLRSMNPSPYMFLVRFGDFDLVGASPEILVSSFDRVARVRPIAGTRKRGTNDEEDAALAAELLADEKERSEHVMLVDLGRNDLGRVCEFGSVRVNEFMQIEKYSHVMHIVSDVTGNLRPDCSTMDLIRATFPAGTVSGAPKVRAMLLIDELEPTRRGSYAGSVGFISATGDIDLAISIRTVLLQNGKGYVQAGAGVVWDSVPSSEHEECKNKARAALAAIDAANRGQLPTL